MRCALRTKTTVPSTRSSTTGRGALPIAATRNIVAARCCCGRAMAGISANAPRRLRSIAAQLASTEQEAPPGHPPLGSLEGQRPALRSWTAAEIVGDLEKGPSGHAPSNFPPALDDQHPAVTQFRQWGYIAITDALTGDALERIQAVFHKHQPRARAVYDASISVDADHQNHSTYSQMYDLPREDMQVGPEAWNSGAWGGYLVTKDESDFATYMDVLANPQVLPLLLALVGPTIHIAESGARTCIAPPREKALLEGGYTSWHRDYGSDGMRLPIGTAGGDYNRVKCFVMLKDVEVDGGCLGLVPGSHLWAAGGPPQEFVGGNMGALPGHVRCAVPAGAMIMFDMRTWHTGLPNTNGENRENLIFTYGGVAPNAIESGEAKWPTGSYGGPAVEQAGKLFSKDFLECAKEIEAQGRLDTPLRRQLFGVDLMHPVALASLS